MLEYLTLGEFIVAVLMGLAALCAFAWGEASGAFGDVEAIKHQVLSAEMESAGGAEGEGGMNAGGARRDA